MVYSACRGTLESLHHTLHTEWGCVTLLFTQQTQIIILEKVFKDTQLSVNNTKFWCISNAGCIFSIHVQLAWDFPITTIISLKLLSVDYENVFVKEFVLINMYSNNVTLKNMLIGWDVKSIRFFRSKRKTFHCFPLDFFGGTPVQFIFSIMLFLYRDSNYFIAGFYIIKVIKPQYLLLRYKCVMLRNLWEQSGYRQNIHCFWKIQA